MGFAARFGRKAIDTVRKGVDFIEKIPVIGHIIKPLTSAVRSGFSVVEFVVGGLKTAKKGLNLGLGLINRGREIVRTGDITQAHDILRGSRDLVGHSRHAMKQARETVEKAKSVPSLRQRAGRSAGRARRIAKEALN